jgi:hypothetical protein
MALGRIIRRSTRIYEGYLSHADGSIVNPFWDRVAHSKLFLKMGWQGIALLSRMN